MEGGHPRIERERKTMEAMIQVYCQGKHGGGPGECADCAELQDYAGKRLEKCPFQDEKPPCAQCPIHCYQPERRKQMKEVMRYSGPRMILRHPLFALRHWLDSFRKVPAHPRRQPAAPLPGGRHSHGPDK